MVDKDRPTAKSKPADKAKSAARRKPAAKARPAARGERAVTIVSTEDGVIDRAVTETDKIDAIVSPRTDDPTARIVPGARVRQCAQCLTDVFVAPSTFAFFKGRPMPPIWCVPCALLAAEAESARNA